MTRTNMVRIMVKIQIVWLYANFHETQKEKKIKITKVCNCPNYKLQNKWQVGLTKGHFSRGCILSGAQALRQVDMLPAFPKSIESQTQLSRVPSQPVKPVACHYWMGLKRGEGFGSRTGVDLGVLCASWPLLWLLAKATLCCFFTNLV